MNEVIGLFPYPAAARAIDPVQVHRAEWQRITAAERRDAKLAAGRRRVDEALHRAHLAQGRA